MSKNKKNKKNHVKSSSTSNSKSAVFKPELISIDVKPLVVLQPELVHQFSYFHRMVGKDEWSGILFYDVVGSISDPDNMRLVCKRMMLKDIGSASYTGFQYDEDIFDFFDKFPETEDMKMGFVHTHHNMNNYFSQTDMEELQENAEQYNYYLSLIASFDCNYTAKLAIPAEIESKNVKIKNETGQEIAFARQTPNKVIYVANCDISHGVDSYTATQVKKLKEKRKKYSHKNYSYGGHNYKNKTTSKKHYDPNSKVAGYIPNKASKNITGNSKKTNPFYNMDCNRKALVNLIMLDTECSGDCDNITIELALKRISETFKIENDLDVYIDNIEICMEDVIETMYGLKPNFDHISEFSENALLLLTSKEETGEMDDSEVKSKLIDMFMLYAEDETENLYI